MQRRPQRSYTLEEYEGVEESSPVKHEYFGGEIFAMAGGSRNHNRIAANVLSALVVALRGGPCEAFGSDMKVATADGLYTCPDVMVVCGEVQVIGQRLEAVTNPVALVEVLSPSTAAYDRGDKFEHYRSIPTLREYVLVDQDAVRVEHFRSGETGEWASSLLAAPGDKLRLSSVGVEIPLAQIYERVA
jgi:Uma2 family endonuclease